MHFNSSAWNVFCTWNVLEPLRWKTWNIEVDPKSSHCNMHILVCVQDTQLVCLWSKIQPSCILVKLHMRCLLEWNGLQAHFYNILCDMEMSTMLLLTAFIHYIIFFWKIKSLWNIWNYILHGFTCIMNKEWETTVQLQNCHILPWSPARSHFHRYLTSFTCWMCPIVRLASFDFSHLPTPTFQPD